MTAVENAPPVVVERSERNPHTRVPVGEVRNADDEGASGPKPAARFVEDAAGVPDVLEHVGHDDDVVAAAHLVRYALFQVRDDERVESVAHTGMVLCVHTGHPMAGFTEPRTERTVVAAEVENAARRGGAEPRDDAAVRAVRVVLHLVRGVCERELARSESHAMEAVPGGVGQHPRTVLHTLEMPDL